MKSIDRLKEAAKAIWGYCLTVTGKARVIRPIGLLSVRYYQKEDLWVLCCMVEDEDRVIAQRGQFLDISINRDVAQIMIDKVKRDKEPGNWGILASKGEEKYAVMLSQEQIKSLARDLQVEEM